MESDTANIVRIIFTILFLGTLVGGGYLFTNFNRFFGPDPNIPSETDSARTYAKTLMVLVWVHAVGITGGFALLMH